jgi:hypothetical protein
MVEAPSPRILQVDLLLTSVSACRVATEEDDLRPACVKPLFLDKYVTDVESRRSPCAKDVVYVTALLLEIDRQLMRGSEKIELVW